MPQVAPFLNDRSNQGGKASRAKESENYFLAKGRGFIIFSFCRASSSDRMLRGLEGWRSSKNWCPFYHSPPKTDFCFFAASQIADAAPASEISILLGKAFIWLGVVFDPAK
jgi:hypothetical protein